MSSKWTVWLLWDYFPSYVQLYRRLSYKFRATCYHMNYNTSSHTLTHANCVRKLISKDHITWSFLWHEMYGCMNYVYVGEFCYWIHCNMQHSSSAVTHKSTMCLNTPAACIRPHAAALVSQNEPALSVNWSQ